MDYFVWLFVRWQGRINRQLYLSSLTVLCLLPLIPKILSLLLGFPLWSLWFDFYFLCTSGPLTALGVKRLHDCDRNLLWGLRIFPLLGLVISALQQYTNLLPSRFSQAWQAAGDETLWRQFVYTVFPFIPAVWFIVMLMMMPGTRGDNRYGTDTLTDDDLNPMVDKIELAMEMIESWVDNKVPFALSLQQQLEWCQLTLSGLGHEEPLGELNLVQLAEQNLDEWNQQAHLVALLKDIEQAAKAYA